MKDQGFTLVELIVVAAIIVVLAVLATLNFKNMTVKANIESQIKQMYSDLMTARIWAMDRNTCHFVLLNGNGSYSIYEDQNNDCVYDAPDTLLLQRTALNSVVVLSPISFNNAAPINTVYPIFDNRGIAELNCCMGLPTDTCPSAFPATISISNTVGAAYDCIVIDTMRTSMGQMNGGSCVPK